MSHGRKSQRLPASFGEASIISLPNWRTISGWTAPSANTLNLLDLGPPPRSTRRTIYWLSLALSIVVHGAFLIYVLASARMPSTLETAIRPQTSVSFIGTAERRALPRADRESPRPPTRPGDTQQLPVQAAAAPEDIQTETRASIDRSEDLASLPSGDEGGEPQAIAVGYQPSPAELGGVAPRRDEAPALTGAPHETRLSFYGLKDVLLKDSRGSRDYIGKAKARPPLGASFAAERASQMYLPEADRRPSPLPEDGRAARATPLSQVALLAVPAPDVLAPPHAVPLPVRRSAMRAALGPATRGDPVEGYRADVRAHLAANRPGGGAGAGSVLVGFTLSRTGKLVSARILRSSGSSALDNSVLGAVRRSAPFPKAPVAATSAQLQFAIPFRFR